MGDSPKPALHEVAYLHEPYWSIREGDWVKSLLLFFDGIALLVPDYMRDRPVLNDPTLAGPLDDLGLLHQLSPESLVNSSVSEDLTTILDELINCGAFDKLSREEGMRTLSYSRMGGFGSEEMADYVIQELQERGLAGDIEEGLAVPLHPSVRGFVLAILPQLIKTQAEAQGLSLQPTASRLKLIEGLLAVVGQPIMPSQADVVSADLEVIGCDLSAVPLDEVLDFRKQHGDEYRRYARDLRRLIRELTLLTEPDQHQAMLDRREELRDEVDRLNTQARRSWRRPLGAFGFGIAGSAASFAMGNPVGGFISAGSALYGLHRQGDPGMAYSYLLQAEEELSGGRRMGLRRFFRR